MSKKHIAMWFVIGWLVAYVLPPQRVVAFVKGKGNGGG